MQEIVQIENNEVMTTSRQIAEVFGKKHTHVIDSIRKLRSKLDAMEQNRNVGLAQIEETTYIDSTNRERTFFKLNKTAMLLTVMAYQTEEALAFKLDYIKQFDAMEEQIKRQELPAKNDALIQWFDRALQLGDEKSAAVLLAEALISLTKLEPALPDPMEKYHLSTYEMAEKLCVTPEMVGFVSGLLKYTNMDGKVGFVEKQAYYSDEALEEMTAFFARNR